MKVITRVIIRDEFGAYLVGRGIGAKIRTKLFDGPPETWPDVLDFSGVEQATESCVDEILGSLARKWGRDRLDNFEIENCSRPVRETINYVLRLIENPPPAPTPDSVARFLAKRERSPRARQGSSRKAARR